MNEPPRRRTEDLHVGRVSMAGAVYFATFVTAERKPWLANRLAADAMLGELRRWHSVGEGTMLAATIMPDHVHVLCRTGARLTIGRCVSRWKSAARRDSGYAGGWQRDFWEHRIRENEPLEDYALYLFLNPYRAGLVAFDRCWPWWWAPEPGLFRFSSMLGPAGDPPVEWIDFPEERFATLATGE